MTLDPIQSEALTFLLSVERVYAALTAGAATPGEPTLGGRLLYAGELDGRGRALMVAGNVAGAASLGACAEAAIGKQAVRDGVADFLVNSLDEGLRILKNEIRKRETVAVCVAGEPAAVEAEMRERGVVADLLAPEIDLDLPVGQVIVAWRVGDAPAQWLPRVDAMALEIVERAGGADLGVARRWLRLAPRYLGRMARGVRVLRCEAGVAEEFVGRVRTAVAGGEIGVEVEVGVDWGDSGRFGVSDPFALKL